MTEGNKYCGKNRGATGNLNLGRGQITNLKAGRVGVTEKVPLEPLLEGGERVNIADLRRAGEAEVTACARALKQEHSKEARVSK